MAHPQSGLVGKLTREMARFENENFLIRFCLIHTLSRSMKCDFTRGIGSNYVRLFDDERFKLMMPKEIHAVQL